MIQSARATDWLRPANQLVYRRAIVWGGYRNWDGGQFHTHVPVFDVKTWHRHSYVIPSDPEDELAEDTIGYVSDDLAAALCMERLAVLRTRTEPWALPPDLEYDVDDARLVRVRGVRFTKADVFTERVIAGMPDALVEGWGLGDARAVLDRSQHA